MVCRKREQVNVISQLHVPLVLTTSLLCRLLGYIWESMAVGSAIDEQRAFRNKFAREDAYVAHSAATNGYPAREDGEDEIDPNDLMQPMPSGPGRGRTHTTQPSGLFNSDDEEWDD